MFCLLMLLGRVFSLWKFIELCYIYDKHPFYVYILSTQIFKDIYKHEVDVNWNQFPIFNPLSLHVPILEHAGFGEK